MLTLITQNVPDTYQPSGNGSLFYAYKSPGGYLTITNNNVLMQLASGISGQEKWSTDMPIPIGGVVLPIGCIGFKLKNQIAGQIAVVSAAIAQERELFPVLGATGTSASGAKLITGRVKSDGTILGGTGFTITKGGAGTYTINFPAGTFGSIPTIVVTPAGGTFFAETQNSTATATSVIVFIIDAAGTGHDVDWQFHAANTI